MNKRIWTMVASGVAIVLVAGGLRQSFGIFLAPITLDLDIGRQVFGLVMAVQALVFGVFQPVTGWLADRHGGFRVITAGALLYALGMWWTSLSTGASDFMVSFGLLVGLGLSGATQVVVLGAIGKVVPDQRRGLVFGTIIAAGSVGMFGFVPGAQAMMDSLGWRETFVILAIAIALLPLIAIALRGGPEHAAAGARRPLGDVLGEARGHRGYMLLTAGFFVCGFHVSFIGTHLPAYLTDNDVSPTAAAYALGLIGLCNVLGAYVFGALGDRFSKKNLLTAIYGARAVVMALMLMLPINNTTALVFGAVMGFLWLATVPLTGGIVAQIFGTHNFTMLFGFVMMSHQFGAFGGAWLGGYIYDVTGSYDTMWMISAALGVAAAALHWPISDRPLARLKLETAS
jgi:MFS family permease